MENQPRRVKREGEAGQSVRQVRRSDTSLHYVPAADEVPRKPWPWRLFFKRLGLVIIFAVLVWVVLFSRWLNYRSVVLKGSKTLSADSIKVEVEEYMDARPLQRNVLFTSSSELEGYLKKQHASIVAIRVSRTPFLQIVVNITESTPALLWQTGGSSWLLGEDGRILVAAPGPNADLGTIIDTAQLVVKPGQKVANAEFVSFARASLDQAKQRGLDIESLSITNTTQELAMRLKGSILIKLDTTRSAEEQLKAYQAAVETAQREGKKITEYVDVRIPGRAYYR